MIRFATMTVLALSASGLAIGGDAYEKAVPADVWGFFACDDVQQTLADFKASEVGRCVMDPAMDAVRQDVMKAFSEMRTKVAEEAGSDPFDMLGKVEGGAALVVFDWAAGDPDFFKSRKPFPRIGFLLGGGDHAADLATQFAELLKKDIDAGKDTQETREVEGVTVTVTTAKAKVETEPAGEVSYAVVGSTFVVTVQPQKDGDRDEIDRLIQGLQGKLDEPLAKKADFESSLAASGGGSGVRAYFDLGGVLRQALEADKDDPGAEMARKFGADRIGRLAGRAKFDAKSDDWAAELRIEGESAIGDILEKLFPASPMSLLNRVSSDVDRGGSLHLDLAAGLAAVLSAMEKIDPDRAKEMQSALDMTSTEKFDLRRDLLEPLGDEIAVAFGKVKDETEALPGSEEDPHNLAVIIKVDDGKAIETTLDTLIQENGMAAVRERSEFEGKIVWTVPAPLIGIKIHFTVQPDMLVISPSNELLKDVLRRGGESKLPSLATDPSFAGTFAAIGQGPFSSVFATDAAMDLKSYFEAAGAMLLALGQSDTAADLAAVDKEKFAEFSSGRAVTVGRIGAEGLYLHGLHRSEKK